MPLALIDGRPISIDERVRRRCCVVVSSGLTRVAAQCEAMRYDKRFKKIDVERVGRPRSSALRL